MKDNTMNRIGNWNWDREGLPLYEYNGGQPSSAKDKLGRDAELPDDPCFILGNYRLTLFVHASGRYQFITGERGWARLNHGGRNQGWSQSLVHVSRNAGAAGDEATYFLAGNKHDDRVRAQRRFGVGYAKYDYNCADELVVSKVISVQPSTELHQGNPSSLFSVTLKNTGLVSVSLRYREELLACYTMMNDQDVVSRRVEYVNHLSANPGRCLAKADISCRPAKLLLLPEGPN